STRCPYTTLFRSLEKQRGLQPVVFVQRQLQRGGEGGPLADKLVVGPQRGQRGQGRGRRGRDGQMGVGPRADAETAGEQGLQLVVAVHQPQFAQERAARGPHFGPRAQQKDVAVVVRAVAPAPRELSQQVQLPVGLLA